MDLLDCLQAWEKILNNKMANFSCMQTFLVKYLFWKTFSNPSMQFCGYFKCDASFSLSFGDVWITLKFDFGIVL